MNKLNILSLFLLAGFFGFSQNKNPFFPQALNSQINSSSQEVKPVLHPNDSVLYFVRINHPNNKYGEKNSQDVWFTELDSTGWTEPSRMSDKINLARYNAIYGVYDNGRTFLVNGQYRKNGSWKKRGISYVRKEGTEWAKPENIKVKVKKINEGFTADYFMNPNQDVLIMSSTTQYNSYKNKLYFSLKNKKGKWSSPKKVKLDIKGSVISPFLSLDKKTLYFSGKTKDGSQQIFTCRRIDEKFKKWTQPTELSSDSLNSREAWDAFFTTNKKGDIAYFSSDRNGNPDIFRVRLFEDRPWADIIEGYVINGFKNTVLDEKPFTVVIEDISAFAKDSTIQLPDSVCSTCIISSITVNYLPREMKYTTQLPFGSVYRLRASVENFISVPTVVDLREKYEHFDMKQDLKVNPLTFARFNGFVVNKKNDSTFTNSDSSIYIFVNNVLYDSAKVAENGSFNFKVALGDTFDIKAVKKGYKSFPYRLDLLGKEEYVEVTQNLFLEELPDSNAYVTYEFFNIKTKKSVDSSKSVIVFFHEKKPQIVSSEITGEKYSYTLKLPLDSVYRLQFEADDFLPESDSLSLMNEAPKTKIYRQVYFTPIEVGASVVLKNIEFEYGKATLKPESFEFLDEAVTFLTKYGSLKIEVGGHTDNQGSAKFNKNLSQQRAKSVADYMISKGLSAERLTSVGYGFDMPIESNDTEEGKAKNRRVEFKVIGK